MKSRLIMAVLICAILGVFTMPVFAHEYDPNDSDNPERLVAYVVYPMGKILEVAVMRPIHCIVSTPFGSWFFGHDPAPRATVVSKEDLQPIAPASKDVEASPRADGMAFTVLGDVLFNSGSAVLTDQGKSLLADLSKTIKDKYPKCPIVVEGHTDNQPIQYSGWKSNWELGFGRAMAILRFLQEQGFDKKSLSAVSFGETREKVPNDTAENRMKNRRAVIVVKTGACCPPAAMMPAQCPTAKDDAKKCPMADAQKCPMPKGDAKKCPMAKDDAKKCPMPKDDAKKCPMAKDDAKPAAK